MNPLVESAGFAAAAGKRNAALVSAASQQGAAQRFPRGAGKLNELGVETQSGGVVKIDLSVATVAELSKKIVGVKAG